MRVKHKFWLHRYTFSSPVLVRLKQSEALNSACLEAFPSVGRIIPFSTSAAVPVLVEIALSSTQGIYSLSKPQAPSVWPRRDRLQPVDRGGILHRTQLFWGPRAPARMRRCKRSCCRISAHTPRLQAQTVAPEMERIFTSETVRSVTRITQNENKTRGWRPCFALLWKLHDEVIFPFKLLKNERGGGDGIITKHTEHDKSNSRVADACSLQVRVGDELSRSHENSPTDSISVGKPSLASARLIFNAPSSTKYGDFKSSPRKVIKRLLNRPPSVDPWTCVWGWILEVAIEKTMISWQSGKKSFENPYKKSLASKPHTEQSSNGDFRMKVYLIIFFQYFSNSERIHWGVVNKKLTLLNHSFMVVTFPSQNVPS